MRMLSPLGSIMRGSVAGLTFMSNQFHQIVVRARTAPVNPKTTNQETMRTAFAAASVLWRGLTDVQRSDWADYAKTVFYPGPLGSYNVTGRNIFMANLGLIEYINARALDTIVQSLLPPTINGVPSWSGISAGAPSVPGTGVGITLENISPDDMNYFITRSQPFHPSRLRFKGPFLSDSAISDEIATLSQTTVDILNLEVDKIYFFKIKGITVDGPHRSTFETIVRAVAQTTVV